MTIGGTESPCARPTTRRSTVICLVSTHTLAQFYANQVSTQSEIGLSQPTLKTLRNAPHREALEWRWEVAQKEWKAH